MARPVVLGNGSLTVGLNEHGLVHDFYFPYVGLENLTNARSVHHKIGVWVDGLFSWVDDGNWTVKVDFYDEYLVSNIEMFSQKLNISLKLVDFVDSGMNMFGRKIEIHNHSEKERDVRLFLHQVFQIGRDGREDTALFVPEENYLLDYKGRCCLFVYEQKSDGSPFDQLAVGNSGMEGKAGTFMDAEDGVLSGSAVEHGGVDSVIGFSFNKMSSNSSETVDYCICASDSQFHLEKLLGTIKTDGLNARLEVTKKHWIDWLGIAEQNIAKIPEQYKVPVKKSLMVIKSHVDKRGGIVASCDSSIYNYGRDYYSYVWPRDGAYAIWPLIRLGFTEEARRFFRFCNDIITPDGYMMHKYQPDRAIGSTWHPLLHGKHKELAIQEDETAVVVFMLGEYLDYSHDEDFVRDMYASFVRPACNFMSGFVDEQTGLPHASYDLWEEKFLTHTYTAAVTYAALKVGASLAERFGFPDDNQKWLDVAQGLLKNSEIFFDATSGALRKGFLLTETGSLQFDNVLDVSSLFGAFMFGYATSKEQITSTAVQIENRLLDQSPSGGTPRYEHDGYFISLHPYMGNPWFVTTLWLSQYYSRINKNEEAKKLIDWSLDKALSSGILSEQIDPETSQIKSVTPLVWSHAELINAILDMG